MSHHSNAPAPRFEDKDPSRSRRYIEFPNDIYHRPIQLLEMSHHSPDQVNRGAYPPYNFGASLHPTDVRNSSSPPPHAQAPATTEASEDNTSTHVSSTHGLGQYSNDQATPFGMGCCISAPPPTLCFVCCQSIDALAGLEMERYLSLWQQFLTQGMAPVPTLDTTETGSSSSSFFRSPDTAGLVATEALAAIAEGSSGIYSAVPDYPAGVPQLVISPATMTTPTTGEAPFTSPDFLRLALVPQALYRSPNSKPGRTGQSASVSFVMGDMGGFPIKDALDKKYTGLLGRDDPMDLLKGRSSISLRVLWPSCDSWKRQIKTTDWRSPPRQITRAKFATDVAKSVKLLIDKIRTDPATETDHPWWVGQVKSGYISIDNLVLVSVEQVAKSSYQPVICLLN